VTERYSAEAANARYPLRKQIVSLLAGDLFMPGNEISRQMAGKLLWLAGLTGQLDPETAGPA
jgi:hypothetical protein